jgi:hypothetical protein
VNKVWSASVVLFSGSFHVPFLVPRVWSASVVLFLGTLSPDWSMLFPTIITLETKFIFKTFESPSWAFECKILYVPHIMVYIFDLQCFNY